MPVTILEQIPHLIFCVFKPMCAFKNSSVSFINETPTNQLV